MDPCPYKFDKGNPRLVINKEQPATVYAAAGAIFLMSLRWYNRRYFRIDQNVANMAAFTLASVPASFSIANFALNDAETEAALLNNSRELQM